MNQDYYDNSKQIQNNRNYASGIERPKTSISEMIANNNKIKLN